ncbi:potassium voltage-gated channel protein Shaw-like [Ylistrum balloti]|uniref:potassium voltage-gated channel protein Shaw-like n=1 Tax=Ylistrum balloti TaxID=509963 RepID=UPI00290583C5|nr:potassium voltage-gated channel protein Shaw-like [Ylistrum balloti]
MAGSEKEENPFSTIMYRVNVGGRQFGISKSVMGSVDGSRLQRLVLEGSHNPNQTDFFYERPSGPFEAILAYHQTGKLHIPGDICPEAFKQELDFWDISPHMLEKCCYHRYLTFSRDQTVMTGFIEKSRLSNLYTGKRLEKTPSFWSRTRSRLRSVLDNKDESLVTQRKNDVRKRA